LALLNIAHDPASAVDQFDAAVELAHNCLRSTDAESAYAYWYRASALQQLTREADAKRDLATAEDSMREAAMSAGTGLTGKYYQGLLGRILQQHSAILEAEGRHEEAQSLLK